MAITDDYDATFHSDTPLSELNSEDKRTVLKSADSRGKTNAACDTSEAASHGGNRSVKPNVRNRTYLATQPAQEGKAALPFRSELPGIDYTQNESPPLLVQCDDCHGAGRVTNDHPNDPWAKVFTCSMCDGTGEVIPECNGWKCREDATEWVDGATWCPVHAAEQKADAESVA
jgi:hypothetical protein